MARIIRAKLVLQLRAEGLAGGVTSASQGMSRRSITAVLEAADAADVGWGDIADQSTDRAYALLFTGRGERRSVFAEPVWAPSPPGDGRGRGTLRLLHHVLDLVNTPP